MAGSSALENPALRPARVLSVGMLSATPGVCRFSWALMSLPSMVSSHSDAIAVTGVGVAGGYFPLMRGEHQAPEG